MEFFALGHRQFAFRDAVTEIYLGRDDGHSLLLDLAVQFFDFAAPEQQLAFAQGVVIPRASGQILGNVTVYQPSLSGANLRVGFPDRSLAFAKGFHFGAHQDKTGFEMLEEVVVVRRGAILRHDLNTDAIRIFGCRFHGDVIIAAARDSPQVTEWGGLRTLVEIS